MIMCISQIYSQINGFFVNSYLIIIIIIIIIIIYIYIIINNNKRHCVVEYIAMFRLLIPGIYIHLPDSRLVQILSA